MSETWRPPAERNATMHCVYASACELVPDELGLGDASQVPDADASHGVRSVVQVNGPVRVFGGCGIVRGLTAVAWEF